MDKTIIQNAMIEKYLEVAYTNNFIYGFELNGIIYYFDSKMIYSKLDKDVDIKGGLYKLRFKPTKKERQNFVNSGCCKILCTNDLFIKECNSNKYNKGENFERLIFELNEQTWKKDCRSYKVDGDITVNNISYQIKFFGATFCNEKILLNK